MLEPEEEIGDTPIAEQYENGFEESEDFQRWDNNEAEMQLIDDANNY
jgi:hypothetical protein